MEYSFKLIYINYLLSLFTVHFANENISYGIELLIIL